VGGGLGSCGGIDGVELGLRLFPQLRSASQDLPDAHSIRVGYLTEEQMGCRSRDSDISGGSLPECA
jgi:hypothetical protein